jgi:hypothetical protein
MLCGMCFVVTLTIFVLCAFLTFDTQTTLRFYSHVLSMKRSSALVFAYMELFDTLLSVYGRVRVCFRSPERPSC